jgi:hypothetical protein
LDKRRRGMPNRGFKYITFLCDNPDESGSVAITHCTEGEKWNHHLNLEIRDCSERVQLDFNFKSEDGYWQRVDKIISLRAALDVLEGRMNVQREINSKEEGEEERL